MHASRLFHLHTYHGAICPWGWRAHHRPHALACYMLSSQSTVYESFRLSGCISWLLYAALNCVSTKALKAGSVSVLHWPVVISNPAVQLF